MTRSLVFLGLAGAAGTLCRFGLNLLVQRLSGNAFPWGTLAVNICGCFLAGLCLILVDKHLQFNAEARLLVFTGFLGAFTTFSAYLVDVEQMWVAEEYRQLLVLMLLHNGLGLGALFSGIGLGRLFW